MAPCRPRPIASARSTPPSSISRRLARRCTSAGRCVFDGAPPSLAALRRHVDARLARVPRFRRRVVQPALGLGDAHWTDDAGFDVARHVHALRLAAPAGDAELRDLAGVLLAQPLDPARPLWRLQLVTGLPGGFAIVGQAHHALVDGLAAVEVATLMLSGAGSGERHAAGARVVAAARSRRSPARSRRRWAPAPAAPSAPARRSPAAGRRASCAGSRAARAARRRRSRRSPRSPRRPTTALEQSITPGAASAFASAPLDALRIAARASRRDDQRRCCSRRRPSPSATRCAGAARATRASARSSPRARARGTRAAPSTATGSLSSRSTFPSANPTWYACCGRARALAGPQALRARPARPTRCCAPRTRCRPRAGDRSRVPPPAPRASA